MLCGSNGASRRIDAHTASIRSRGSTGPSMSGSGRIDGIAGMQFVTSSPLSRMRARLSASPPWGSFISQMPIPSAPAAA